MDMISPNNRFINTQGTGEDRGPAVQKPAKQKTKRKSTKWLVLMAVVLLALCGFLAWQYLEVRKEVKRLSDPQVAAQESTAKLLAEVGQLIELPGNETPTIATVVNADELKSQPFFENAENGDQVLIYSQAKEAILYRPSTKKIIKVAPVDLGGENR